MIIAGFLVADKRRQIRFFEETFLLADTSIEIALEMLFLSFNNANIEFVELSTLTWRTCTIEEIICKSMRVKLINKYDFVKTIWEENSEIFVIHIAVLEAETLIYLSQTAQIAVL